MQMHKPKTYIAHVFGPKNVMASVVCVTFNLTATGAEAAARFHEIVCEFPNIEAPTRSPLSFRDELRWMSIASAVIEGPRENEENFIAHMMSEAYGPLSDLKIDELT